MPDITMIEKIEKLLAQANATTYEEEARTFLDKAQSLMTKYSIDQELIQLYRPSKTYQKIITQIYRVTGTQCSHRTSLLGVVAMVNDCKVIQAYRDEPIEKAFGGGYCRVYHIVGHESDVEATITLFTSLNIQLSRYLLGNNVKAKQAYTSTRNYNRGFIYGYTSRISQLLQASRRGVEQQYSNDDLLPVLRDKAQRVEDEFRVRFPHTGIARLSGNAGSGDGYSAGARAAEKSDLGHTRIGSQRGELVG